MASTSQKKWARILRERNHLRNLTTEVFVICLSYLSFLNLYTSRAVSTEFRKSCNKTLQRKQCFPDVHDVMSQTCTSVTSNMWLALQNYSPNLKRVCLRPPKEILSTFKKLESIDWGFCELQNLCEVFTNLPNLTSVSFECAEDVDLNMFRTLNLRRLEIISDSWIENFADMLKQQSSLEYLCLDHYDIRDTELFEVLTRIGSPLPAMKSFDVCCCGTDLYLKTLMKFMPNLDTLQISSVDGIAVTKYGLAAISTWKSLRVLDIYILDYRVTSLGTFLHHLTFEHLVSLNASPCEWMHDDSLETLPAVMPNLEYLVLGDMLCTMVGLCFLMGLKCLKELRVSGRLNLDLSDFDSGGNVFGNLKRFVCHGCNNGDDVKPVLRKIMPKAELLIRVYSGKLSPSERRALKKSETTARM